MKMLTPAEAADVLNISEDQLTELVPPTFYASPRNPRWSKRDLLTLSAASGECRLYVVRRASSNEVKIGISTNPVFRLRQLQSAHGERLELVAVFPGDVVEEAQLHERFKSGRKLGEWFTETQEISEWLREIAK